MKIISRAEAIALGLKQYFTGEPCKHGHVAHRLVVHNLVSGRCIECRRVSAQKNYREAHPGAKYREAQVSAKKERIAKVKERSAAIERDKQARREAVQKGDLHYESEVACRNGHKGLRYANRNICVECVKAQSLANYAPKVERSHHAQERHARCEAKAGGLRFYESETVCAHGHKGLRYAASGNCVECARAKSAAKHGLEEQIARTQLKLERLLRKRRAP
jgi:hypothetical protein